MSNPVMFVIKYWQGPDYESWSGTIGVATTEAEAKAIADDCARRYWDRQDAIVALRALIDEAQQVFNATDPRPEHPTLHDRPRWKAGLRKDEITQAMRDERKRVEKLNQDIMEQHRPVVEARVARFDAAMQAVVKANPELCQRIGVSTYEEFQNNNQYHPPKNDPDGRCYYVKPLPVLTLDSLGEALD